ncbi:hypothetical protein OAR90_02425 [Nitrosopumilus sp.]|nr:hypothetical protein [Nitrosopumilus sp.]
MTVSSSKFRFSLIVLSVLLVAGTGMGVNQALGAAPTFIAIHNSTTTTEIVFSEGVNGTKRFVDWTINSINATAITNGTAPSASDLVYSAASITGGNNAVGSGAETFGFFNRTLTMMLTHHEIGTGDTLVVNYTGNNKNTAGDGNLRSSPENKANDAFDMMSYITGTEATALDQIPPTALSATMIDAKRIQVKMSEPVGNYNTTAEDFYLTGAPGVRIGSITADNSTATAATGAILTSSDIIYLTTTQPFSYLSNHISLNYGNLGGGYERGDGDNTWPADNGAQGVYITDDTNSYMYGCAFSCDYLKDAEDNDEGVGNRLANFTGLTLFNILNSNGEASSIHTDTAPELIASSVQVNSKMAKALVTSSPINLDVEVGDKVTFEFTITDDNGSFYIPYVALYTNFIDRPDDMNLFYTNNFDSVSQESTSYYEWNVRSDDTAYDYSNTISWNDATYTVIDDSTIEVTFSMDIENTMNPTQVWLQIGDTTYNYNNLQLPVTFDVTGDELMTFENSSNQKLLGFLNESVLSTIVSGWTKSNDDLANVEQLSSALGVQDQVLPAWTTNLANWVVDDEIYAADMIVAVEYIINQ